MTIKEKARFKELFRKYCREEINKGKCGEYDCGMCIINDAYEIIFSEFENEEDEEEI